MRIKKGFHIDSFSFGYNSNAKNPNISDSFPVDGQRWIGRAKVSSLKNRTVYSDYFDFRSSREPPQKRRFSYYLCLPAKKTPIRSVFFANAGAVFTTVRARSENRKSFNYITFLNVFSKAKFYLYFFACLLIQYRL